MPLQLCFYATGQDATTLCNEVLSWRSVALRTLLHDLANAYNPYMLRCKMYLDQEARPDYREARYCMSAMQWWRQEGVRAGIGGAGTVLVPPQREPVPLLLLFPSPYSHPPPPPRPPSSTSTPHAPSAPHCTCLRCWCSERHRRVRGRAAAAE